MICSVKLTDWMKKLHQFIICFIQAAIWKTLGLLADSTPESLRLRGPLQLNNKTIPCASGSVLSACKGCVHLCVCVHSLPYSFSFSLQTVTLFLHFSFGFTRPCVTSMGFCFIDGAFVLHHFEQSEYTNEAYYKQRSDPCWWYYNIDN